MGLRAVEFEVNLGQAAATARQKHLSGTWRLSLFWKSSLPDGIFDSARAYALGAGRGGRTHMVPWTHLSKQGPLKSYCWMFAGCLARCTLYSQPSRNKSTNTAMQAPDLRVRVAKFNW